MTKLVDVFNGQYLFLSNFFPVDLQVKIEDLELTMPTVEHAFQAAKGRTKAEWIYLSEVPAHRANMAKRRGRSLFLRPDWELVKISVMSDLISQKFDKDRNPKLYDSLQQLHGAYLEEGNNWHDNEWGNCHCPRCKNTNGKNLLGLLLMREGGWL